MTIEKCWFCKEHMRGSASTWTRDEGRVSVCHEHGHDCYHLVTVYQFRSPEEVREKIAGGALHLVPYWSDES
jgi:hypothetical protein